MHYHHLPFVFLFMPVVVLLFYFMDPRFRQGYLLAVSAIWVAVVSPLLLAWILASSVIDFYLAAQLRGPKSKIIYYAALGIHLAGFFGCRILLESQGFSYGKVSFFTGLFGGFIYLLNSIGYLTEVKRGTVSPSWEYWPYLSYLLFFPKFLAGPWISFRRWSMAWSGFRTHVNWGVCLSGLVLFSFGLLQQVFFVESLKSFVLDKNALAERLSLAGMPVFLLGIVLLLVWEWHSIQWMARGMGRMLDIKLSSGIIPGANGNTIQTWLCYLFRPFYAWVKLVLGRTSPWLRLLIGPLAGLLVQTSWNGLISGTLAGILTALPPIPVADRTPKWLLVLRGGFQLLILGALFAPLFFRETPLEFWAHFSWKGFKIWPFYPLNIKQSLLLFIGVQVLVIPLFLGATRWYFSWGRPFTRTWYRVQGLLLLVLWMLLLLEMPLFSPFNQLLSSL